MSGDEPWIAREREGHRALRERDANGVPEEGERPREARGANRLGKGRQLERQTADAGTELLLEPARREARGPAVARVAGYRGVQDRRRPGLGAERLAPYRA